VTVAQSQVKARIASAMEGRTRCSAPSCATNRPKHDGERKEEEEEEEKEEEEEEGEVTGRTGRSVRTARGVRAKVRSSRGKVKGRRASSLAHSAWKEERRSSMSPHAGRPDGPSPEAGARAGPEEAVAGGLRVARSLPLSLLDILMW